MLNAPQEIEIQDQDTESATASNDEIESGEVESTDDSLSDDTTDDHEEQDDDSESEDEPDLTPGVKKRIAKLKAKQERREAELRAEFDAKFYQLQQQVAKSQQPLQTEQMLQQQYQQAYGNQYGQNTGYQPYPGYVDPNQPQAPTFDQFKQWQEKADLEKKQQAGQAEFQTGINSVVQNIQARGYQDPDFSKLVTTYGNLFTPEMTYALKALKNPSSFVKHVLKNPKDHAALRQLQSKNKFEQVVGITEWGTKYESQSATRTQVTSKPKPIAQPKGGGSASARSRPGLDIHNPTTHSKENIRAFLAGR